MDFEFEHYREPLNPGEGGDTNLLRSIGSFLKHNIEDIFDDLAPQEPADRPRSTSCPRGLPKGGQRLASHPDSQYRTAAQRHVESQWKWDSPPRSRPGDRSTSSVSLTTSPDSKGLLDVVVSGFSNLGHQATAFLNTLDANFEQIFKPEDNILDEMRPLPQPVSALPPARPTGARPLPGSRSSKPKGKLGANRLVTAASAGPAPAPAPAPASASVSSSSLQLQPPSSASRAASLPTSSATAGNTRVQGASPQKPAARQKQNSKAGTGAGGGMSGEAGDVLPQLPKRGGNQGMRESSRAAAAPPSEQTAPAASQPSAAAQSSEGAVAGAAAAVELADGSSSGPVSQEGASADPAAASTTAPAAGAVRALGAVDKRRCLKVLFQEVASLKEERCALQQQLQDMAGRQSALELQLEQLGRHSAELEAENERLRQPASAAGHDPVADEAVLRQLQLLLSDKSRLAEENSRLASENHSLHLLLALTTEHSTLLGSESGSEWPSPAPARPAERCDADGLSPHGVGDGSNMGAGQVPGWEPAAAVRSLDYSQEVAEVSEIRQYYADLLGTPSAYEQRPPVLFAGGDDQWAKDSAPCGGSAADGDQQPGRPRETGWVSDADCSEQPGGGQQPQRQSFECEALVKLHEAVQASAKEEPCGAASPAASMES